MDHMNLLCRLLNCKGHLWWLGLMWTSTLQIMEVKREKSLDQASSVFSAVVWK